MARNLFGGTAADTAEDASGARAPGAPGTVWAGSAEGSTQVTDLTTEDGAPIAALTADDNGMVPAFYGPDGAERLWVDFGGGRVALVSATVGERFRDHLTATDPHGSQAAAVAAIEARMGKPTGLATLDASGKVTNSQLCTYQPGVYVPTKWGAFWKAKRDAALSGSTARVVVVGGSASQGYYASNLHSGGWVGGVRQALQTHYGDGGSGMFPASRTAAYIKGASDTAALAAWTANKSVAGHTGIWTVGGSNFGPGTCFVYTQTAGSSLTFTVSGTVVKIYTVTGASTRAGYTYSIDGATPVAVANGGGSVASIQTTAVSGLSPGTHTVTVTWNGTSSGAEQYLSVCGISGENTAGVIVDNLAKAGALSSTFGNHSTSALNAVWNGGTNYPADLVIYTAGPNDAAAGTPGDTWAANVARYLKAIRDSNSGQTEVMILLPHLGNHDTTNFLYQDYAIRARGLAEAYDAVLVDLWALGRNSWPFWNSSGYWGTSANPGQTGTDSVHLSDKGYEYVASIVTPLLMS